MSDAGTRLTINYSLAPPVRRLAPVAAVGEILPLGGMQRFADAAATLLPRIVLIASLADGDLRVRDGATPLHARVIALQTPRGDVLVVVEAVFGVTATASEISQFGRAAHLGRDEVTIEGRPVAAWVGERLGATRRLAIEYMHEVAFVAGDLGERIIAAPAPAEEAVDLLVGRAGTESGDHSDVRTPGSVAGPSELNVTGVSVLLHNRVMTLAAGWDRVDEHKLLLVALLVIGGFSVMHRARDRAFGALEFQAEAGATSVAEGRAVLARLGTEISEVQLDLSFGVEAYLDSVLLPNHLMQNYRESLNVQVGLDRAMANTSRMVERLGAVIQARAAVLAAAEQEARNQRDRVTSTFLAVGSTIAIPASLLLTYFGVNSTDVDPQVSVLDFAHYWPAYAVVWLPFLALLAVAAMLRRRIRTRPVELSIDDPERRAA